MARLSRTAKFQELRDRINSDTEALGKTEELNNLQNKLENIQNILDNNAQQESTPVVEEIKEEPAEIIHPFGDTETSIEDTLTNAEDSFEKLLSQLEGNVDKASEELNNSPAFVNPFTSTTPVNPFSVTEEKKPEVEEVKVVEPIVEPVEVTPAVIEPTPVVEKPAVVKEPEVINIIDTSTEAIAKRMFDINIELNGKVEPVKEEEKKPVVEEPVATPVVEVKEEPVAKPVEEAKVETTVTNPTSSYVDETLKEVKEYNKNDGRKTIDEIPNDIIDTIRHPEENKLSSKDDEFSNTVSIELDKVLSEISNTQQIAAIKEEEAKVEKETEKTIAHPTLAKAVEEVEDGIEIKSLEETMAQEVLEQTIPFEAEKVETTTEIVEEEDDDDSAPNKILNVILIILIVILVAILGVIVYYILYAKGIIG